MKSKHIASDTNTLVLKTRTDAAKSLGFENLPELSAIYDHYEPHALRWSPEEALRLAAWVGVQSGALATLEKEALQKLNKEALTRALAALWGRKLGSEGSREARSANWVIAALSDLKGQTQARDLVRFLHQAAVDSEKDVFWKDRILAPTAIRGALQVCSKEKINEIGIENNELIKRYFQQT